MINPPLLLEAPVAECDREPNEEAARERVVDRRGPWWVLVATVLRVLAAALAHFDCAAEEPTGLAHDYFMCLFDLSLGDR